MDALIRLDSPIVNQMNCHQFVTLLNLPASPFTTKILMTMHVTLRAKKGTRTYNASVHIALDQTGNPYVLRARGHGESNEGVKRFQDFSYNVRTV